VSTYQSPEELREVLDKVFAAVAEDPELGPEYKAADTATRYEFSDLEQVLNVRSGRPGEEGNLLWQWSDTPGWEPRVRLTMTAETANSFFQGKENVAVALATKKVTAGGDVKAALGMIPVNASVHARYRAVVEADYPHLVV
jgi:hypothetical protein